MSEERKIRWIDSLKFQRQEYLISLSQAAIAQIHQARFSRAEHPENEIEYVLASLETRASIRTLCMNENSGVNLKH